MSLLLLLSSSFLSLSEAKGVMNVQQGRNICCPRMKVSQQSLVKLDPLILLQTKRTEVVLWREKRAGWLSQSRVFVKKNLSSRIVEESRMLKELPTTKRARSRAGDCCVPAHLRLHKGKTEKRSRQDENQKKKGTVHRQKKSFSFMNFRICSFMGSSKTTGAPFKT